MHIVVHLGTCNLVLFKCGMIFVGIYFSVQQILS